MPDRSYTIKSVCIFNKNIDSQADLLYYTDMQAAQTVVSRFRHHKTLRAQDLVGVVSNPARVLQALVASGELKKAARGLYYMPTKTAFGAAPPSDTELVRTFLKSDDFVLTSPNYFNSLGLGLTQLFNQQVVYNNKRHGKFTLSGREFTFRRRVGFPKKLTPEFLVVDLLNNLDNSLADADEIQEKLRQKVSEFDLKTLKKLAEAFGKVRTRKFVASLQDQHAVA